MFGDQGRKGGRLLRALLKIDSGAITLSASAACSGFPQRVSPTTSRLMQDAQTKGRGQHGNYAKRDAAAEAA